MDKGAGLPTDRPGARKGHHSERHPTRQKGKHQARWTKSGVKFNGGSFDTRAEAIQRRLSMESDIIEVAGLDRTILPVGY